jgi:hypothetical protein
MDQEMSKQNFYNIENFISLLNVNLMMKSLLFLLLFYLYSCVNPFAPKETDDPRGTGEIITDQRTPEEVLTNFRYAYNFKDSLVYSDILDNSFLFISKNYTTDPVTDITWGRDVDIKTTVGLFHHFQTIDLMWGGTIYKYYSEDSTVFEIKNTFQLTLNGGKDIPTLNGEALFYIRKEESGIWRIIRWEDLSTF